MGNNLLLDAYNSRITPGQQKKHDDYDEQQE
jgi:hypothetical protein